MEKYISVLEKTRMFENISRDEIRSMLSCLQAKIKSYKKGELVFAAGDRIDRITMLMEGSLHIRRDDYWGNRVIINIVKPGDMFGESYLSRQDEAILNDVVAVEDSVVMFFDVKKVLTTCSAACHFHSMVVQNLFFAISDKNRDLVRKIGHMSKRTTRDKLISYLSEEAGRQGSSQIIIPLNRQQLADFLCVDRSAMSNELSKMRDEGMLEFEKNRFTLLE